MLSRCAARRRDAAAAAPSADALSAAMLPPAMMPLPPMRADADAPRRCRRYAATAADAMSAADAERCAASDAAAAERDEHYTMSRAPMRPRATLFTSRRYELERCDAAS